MCNLCDIKNYAAANTSHSGRRSFLKAASTLPLWAGAIGSTSFLPSALAADVTPKPENILTPDAALERLLAGNKRFVEGNVIKNPSFKNIPAGLRSGQNPYACILSCADSRVGPELCFDEGQGDLFVARLAGNYVNTDMLASLEYGALMLKSPLIMVLGHTECGAISAAIKAEKDNVDFPGHIQVIASKLDQAVRRAKAVGGKRTTEVAIENVKLNVAELRQSTPIIRKLADAGQLKIVGGLYDLETGKVSLVA
jgi:carbonic anhydrase